MRWDGQEVDAEDGDALPGLGRMRGVLRTVSPKDMPGVRFHEVAARSALNAVPGNSPMPFRWTINPYRGCTHACVYCLSGDTSVLMADGRSKPLAGIHVGDRIYGTERRGTYRRWVTTEVLAHWETVKPAVRVTLEDGSTLVASPEHRFLTKRGWKHVTGTMSGPQQRPYLTLNDELMGFGVLPSTIEPDDDYRRGYLAGMIRGDGHLKTYRYPGRPGRTTEVQHRFRLALVDDEALDRSQRYLSGIGVPTKRFAFAAETAQRRPLEAIRTSTAAALGLITDAIRWPQTASNNWLRGFLAAVKTSARLRVVGIEPLGFEMPMYDITTGTGDFVANGVVSHNCYARGTHSWLELDTGTGFDREIVVKVNVGEVLAREVVRPTWTREHVALGTNTDPYQRAEGRYALMPGIIKALAGSGTPFSILTKGTLLRRDIPLLQQAAADVPIGLGVSLAIYDDELHAALEPGTPDPRARLQLVRAMRDAGLPCGVMLAPVLPWLTDTPEHLDKALSSLKEAGATGVTVLALHLRPGAREWFFAWLARERPDLVKRYEALYARGANVPGSYRRSLAARVQPILERHGFAKERGGALRGIPGDEDAEFPQGSLPTPERRTPSAGDRPARAALSNNGLAPPPGRSVR